tara:strand:+ start:2776 stop:2955 length:180 start_codon:yes stop_codon:yes gene_type:complete
MRIQFNNCRVQISKNNRLMGGKLKNVMKTASNIANLNNEFAGLGVGKRTKKTKKLVLKL